MKNQLKNYLKVFVLLLGVSVLLWNCEKEEDSEIYFEKNQKAIIQKYSFDEIVEDANFLELIKSTGTEKLFNREFTKSSSNGEYDFKVIKESVNKVVYDEYTSYTFLIQRDKKNTESIIENLVIEERADEKPKAVLVKYKPSQEYIESKNMPFTGVMSIEKIKYSESILKNHNNCVWVTVYSARTCSVHGSNGHNNSNCAHYGGSGFSMSRQYVCFGSKSGGSSSSWTVFGTNGSGGGGSSGGTASSPVFPCDDAKHGCDKDEATSLKQILGLSNAQYDWLSSQMDTATDINKFLKVNNFSKEAKDEAKSAIDILSVNLSENDQVISYEREIKKITKHLRQFGDLEDELFSDYVESLIPDFTKMTRGEVFDIYKLTKAVLIPFAEAAIPFIEYAIIDATLGAAIPLLTKIPVSMVLRGARLNKMVKSIGLIGIKGSANNIRIVTTKAPISKAKELFKTLTKNAISKTTESGGLIKANMGKGNFITYRPLTSSSSGYPATISLDFRAAGIWTKIRNIKFKRP